MKHLFTFLLLFIALAAQAVPADRRWRTNVQSDGTVMTFRMLGDEHAHCLASKDGFVLKRLANGDLTYMTNGTSQSRLTVKEWSANIAKSQQTNIAKSQQANNSRVATTQTTKSATGLAHSPLRHGGVGRGPKGTGSFTGSFKGLFVLVQFPDVQFSRSDIKAVYDSICNVRGLQKPPYHGSVRDYFLEQSDGQFDLSFDIIGPVTVSHDESYYGANSSMGGGDNDVRGWAREVIDLIKDSVDFANYDWNNDGTADQVFLLYAGYGEAQYGPDWTIWPCEGQIDTYGTNVPEYNGIKVNTFACACELRGNKGSDIDGIGTTCHEFSHCMGLPDFYNSSNFDDFCMDAYDVMDQGAYNGRSYCPAGYTGYERMYCGWRQPVEISTPQQITGWKPLSKGGVTYMLRNEGHPDEYYLLDNREYTGFDSLLYSPGLVVTHVDYDANAWANNTVNATSGHHRMALVPADDIYDIKTSNTDAFPYTYLNGQRTLDSLTDYGHPRTTLYNTNSDGYHKLRRPIYNIKRDSTDMTVSFSFMRREQEQPAADPFERHVLVEEGTGTRCANCPRGFVGMEKVKEKWPDKAVVVAVHQYDNRDPMYLTHSDYPDCDWVGFPDCVVNRGSQHYDPFYGSLGGYTDHCAITDYIADEFTDDKADVGITAKAEWNADSTAVNATATVETKLAEGTTYEVQFILVGDSLRGSENAWVQSNIYYDKQQSDLPDELKQFGINGENWYSDGGTRLTFNDVAIASSYRLGRTQFPQFSDLAPGDKRVVSYTLQLPVASEKKSNAQNLLPAAIKKNHVRLVACVANQWGVDVYNCVSVPVVKGSGTDGITSAKVSNDEQPVGYYSIDGRRLQAPQRGLNLIRLSNGKVVKRIIK